jgi:hypothetical protein
MRTNKDRQKKLCLKSLVESLKMSCKGELAVW